MTKNNLGRFFEIIESDLQKRKKVLTILAVIVGILALLPLRFFLSGEISILPSQIYAYIFIVACIAVMFGVGFHSIYTKSNFYKRKDFQWFIKHPENLTSYKIIAGGTPQIELYGNQNKTIFYIKGSLAEAENRLFTAFPHLKPKVQYEVQPKQSEILAKEPQGELLNKIPKEFLVYFMSMENFTQDYLKKKYFAISIPLFIVIVFGFSVYSFFTGMPDFLIFGYRNIAFYLLIWVAPASVLYVISDFYETKKWMHFFQKNTDDIVWIYTSQAQNSINGIPAGKSYGIYIANSEGKKLHLPLTSDRVYEVFGWLDLYFDNAISGYLHQYNEIYKTNPKNFVSQVKNLNQKNDDF